MPRWVLDTNVYIRASRERGARLALDRFLDRHFSRTDFAATVWLELQVGVRNPSAQRGLDEMVAPYVERGAMLAPAAQTFQQAGRVLAALAVAEGLELDAVRPSLHHDVLLACTVREHGRTLVTANAADFARIRRQLRGFRFVTTLPLR